MNLKKNISIYENSVINTIVSGIPNVCMRIRRFRRYTTSKSKYFKNNFKSGNGSDFSIQYLPDIMSSKKDESFEQGKNNSSLEEINLNVFNSKDDILNEAKENCWLSYKKLEKVVLDKEFVLEELDVESFPKIDIKKDA